MIGDGDGPDHDGERKQLQFAMNLGTQIYAVLELICFAVAALAFFSLHRRCLFFPKARKEAVCRKYPLLGNQTFTLFAWLFMSAFLIFAFFESTLPAFGVF